MKKFAAVFLLLIFLCNTAGIFGLFLLLREDNYEFVFSRTAGELNLVHLVIAKSEKISWEKKDEIVYEGKYYDVFSKSEDTENFYLLCYADSKDDSLTQAFHKHLNDHCAKKKNQQRTALKIVPQNYLMQRSDWNIYHPIAQNISTRAFTPTVCGFASVFSPPPDFLV